ncbi:hypothetical protein AB4Z09_28895 [Rhodococcus sp. TAF43]|uniref:hypothetical protein n=1 Tax=unclassified Rhodococcus (in: high G+C Gram-positive bacteria) TaxID=192944 RepID=UPI001583B071|nr:hypothetical protein [Rhodococcus sp. W8901]QKT10431.1 hypothetical protein HUN07_06600 [Rhodococcus sp. W8901]
MNIIDRLIANHPNLHGHPCSGYGVIMKAGKAHDYLGNYRTHSLMTRTVHNKLELIGHAFGPCELEQTDTGIRATYKHTGTSIEFDLFVHGCDGHFENFGTGTFQHPGEGDSPTTVELDLLTTHGEDGAVDYTQWSVWFRNDQSTAVRPQDIPELIESLRVMHSKWLAATSVRAAA